MPTWTPTLISNLPAHAQPALLNLRDLMLGQLPLWWLLVSVVITLLFLIFLYRTFTRTTDARLAALRYRFPTGVVIITIWASFGIYAISAANLLMIALFAVTGLLGYGLATRGGHPFTTEAPIYIASRLPANNIFFPPQVCIQPTLITYYRPRLIGRNEQSISITQMASINIQTRLLWADVIIETTGGAEPIVCHGHTKADAIAIKAQIEHYQRQYFTPAGAPLPRDRDNIPFPPSADAAPVSPNGPTLMLSLYHRDPAGADALQRWEQPIKRVRIPADTPPDTRDATLLALLEEGGPGSHVNVQTLTTP